MATIYTAINDDDVAFDITEPAFIPDRDLPNVADANLPTINNRVDYVRNQTLIQMLDDIAAPLHIDAGGLLLKQWLSYKGFGDHHIDSYDNWITKGSHNNVYSRALTLPNGDIIYFENLRIFEPLYSRDGKALPMTPKLAREQGVTYGNDWHVDVVQRRGGILGEVVGTVRSVCIGTIPTMLKSIKCILRNKTPRELALLGEESEDIGGYFIVGGTEKNVLLQEQLAAGKIYIMNLDTKGTTVVRMTANTPRGTALIELALDKKTKSVLKIRFPSLRNADQSKKYRSINVLRVFRLLGMNDIKAIEALITLFIKPANVKKSMLQLTRNVVDFIVFPDDVTVIAAKLGKAPEQINETLASIKYIIDTDLFPHVNNLPGPDNETDEEREVRIRSAKLNLLAIMVSRFLEHLAGYRPLDNRDSWSNKRVQGAGNLMEQLFRNAWRKTLGIVQNEIDKNMVKDLNSIVEKIRYSIITDTFHDSFITSNWGVRGTQMKNNIAQTLDRSGVIATYAHINTIDVAISRNDRQPSLRVVQMDQWGFVDPVSTPEGENAGLVKALSLLAETSLDRNDNEIIRLLIGTREQGMLELVSNVPVIGRSDKLIINGKFLGWCNGPESRELLVNMRRNGEIPLDLSVILEDDWLYIDLTPSRLIRPVLIVDPDQGLAIARLGLEKAANHTLLTSGAVEYISPWEQEYLKIAVDVKEIAKRKGQIDDARQAHNAALVKLQELKTRKQFQDLQTQTTIRQDLVTDIQLKEANELVNSAQQSLDKVLLTKPYTHCEIDPTVILSVASALIPWPNHNQAPRNTYQVSMGKQALGIYHRNHKNRFDGKTKLLAIPSRPMVETEMSNIIGLDQRGPGENVFGSFMAFPYTEEDSFIKKREYLDNGGMRIMKYLVYKTVVHHSGEHIEILKRPEALANEPANRYKYIQMFEADNPMNGLPMYGGPLSQGDCVIGKIQYVAATNTIHNESVFLRVGDEGIVDKVSVTSDNKTTTISVKLRIMRVPQEGDKFAPRNAQKGTVGLVISEVYLPANRDGVASDITMNPHSMPSRMTMEYPMEIIAATAGAYRGTRENATAFRPFPLDTYRKTLIEYVVNKQPEAKISVKERTDEEKKILQSLEFCYNIMTSGISGRPLEVPIYGGLVFFQALKHHVKDKIQARSTGQVKPMTRQPPKGRGNRGGLQFGEMERDAAISHGASSLLRERLMKASDAYTCVFCRTCGNFAVNDIGLPTGAAGEEKQKNYKNCRLCDDNNFGRSVIPYAYKLLIHLLAPFQQFLRPEFVTFSELLDSIFNQRRGIARGDVNDVGRQLAEADEGFEDEENEAEEEQGMDVDLGDVYE